MKPEELERACLQAIESRTRITLPWPKGQRIPTGFPTGFPTGEILSETASVTNRSYKPEKLLRWLRDNNLIGRNF